MRPSPGDNSLPQYRAVCAAVRVVDENAVKPLRCLMQLLLTGEIGDMVANAEPNKVCLAAGEFAFDTAVDTALGQIGDPGTRLNDFMKALKKFKSGLGTAAFSQKAAQVAKNIPDCTNIF